MNLDIRYAGLIVVAIIAIMGTFALIIRPEVSKELLPWLGSIITGIIGIFILVKQDQTHTAFNSKMDAFLEVTRDSARAEGVLEGQKNASSDRR